MSPASTVKREARRILEQLPDEPTWDDLFYALYIRQTIEAGLRDCRKGRTVPVAEVRRRLGLPTSMSAEMVSSADTVEICIPLLNEGTDVLRPTKGLVIRPNIVQVIATTDYDPTMEEWEFPPGSAVRCAAESKDSRTLLVARHRADDNDHE